MATICYRWDDAPYNWDNAPFTWEEACVIEKVVEGAGGPSARVRNRLKNLNEDEKKTLIELFLRLQVDEIVIEKRMNKHKNKKVKIKLKDIELKQSVEKIIKVNVKLD